jgi:hypothetical protein
MGETQNHDVFSLRYYELLNKINDETFLNSLSKDELKNLMSEAEEVRQIYKNLELIVKRDANSLYGTSASIYFSLGDFDVAEDITISGKHSGIIVDVAINNFFKYWGEKELKVVQQFYPNVVKIRQFTEYQKDTINDICVYGDTDSRYLDIGIIYNLLIVHDQYGFEEPLKIPENTIEGNKSISDFGIFLMENFINNIISETLKVDIVERNAKLGYLKMAHEVTTRKCIFQAKKKYIMSVIWKDGKFLSKTNLVYKGVELKKGELNKRVKKIIKLLVEKFLLENYTKDQIREEILKLIKYIKARAEKDFVYKNTSVSGLKNIYKNENGIYISSKNHIQMKIALFWYNFLEKNNLQQDYAFPFEGQKMCYYYANNNIVVGVPDDVDINKVPNLPEPDWNKNLNMILVKSMLKYISEIDNKKINDKSVENFLLNVREITI